MISNCLRDFLATWHEWATGDAVEDKPFWRGYGLCSNLRWRFDEGYDTEQILAAYREMEAIFEKFPEPWHPFGLENYNQRGEDDSMPDDPIRLAWVEKMLESCGVIPRPKQYRGWKLQFEYGNWWATSDNYEAEPDGDSWVGNGLRTSARTLDAVRQEVDTIIEERGA